MNQTHVQTDAGKRGHIVLERAPGSDAAHTGRFACAGAPIAHGTNTAKPFMRSLALARTSLISIIGDSQMK